MLLLILASAEAFLTAPAAPHRLALGSRRHRLLAMGIDADAERWITQNIGPVKRSQRLGGSSWASFSRYTVEGKDSDYFVKSSSRPSDVMFLGEAVGLRAMHATGTVTVPEVMHFGDGDVGGSFMVMSYLDMSGRPDPTVFGRKLAEMHAAPCAQAEAAAGKFGFDVENTIGGTPQPNAWCDDWVQFFREQRIGHQVKTAGDARIRKEWDAVLAATDGLASLFEGVEVKPSVLHGDLWSGNIGGVGDGEPAIFDPAVYYGHHEAEWGMSWCASFPPLFWKGYREIIPKDDGFDERAVLYELYHKLNHYNLFGGGYYYDSLGLMGQLSRR